jgi:signal transduction histidine kinase
VPAALLLATAAALGATALADRSIHDLADLSLRTTAAEIAAAAESGARAASPPPGELERSFSDRVVAYALLADAHGLILFHTNPARRGARLPATDTAAGGPDADAGRRIELGTGRPAYELTRTLRAADGSRRLLRVVIYTAGADRVLERARGLWLSVAAVLVLLWAAGALVWRLAARTERLERRMRRQEELSLIGQMTATLAHEIRNALGGIKGHAQWLDEKTAADDPRKPGLAAIVGATARVESLVGELLLFSREETYALRDLPADDVLAAAVAAAAGWRGTVIVRPSPGVVLHADPEKVLRALANAVRNAVEAAGEGGAVTLGAEARGGEVALTVADDGPGIEPQALGRLFSPFYTTKGGGTGLGLAYARKVAEGMGGTATLENRIGDSGAVFRMTVPRARR